jgi:L-cysteine/cystine lyase
VSFRLHNPDGSERSTAAVVQQLGKQAIWIRRLDDPDCLRACTHITTTPAEIDQLLAALATLLGQ